ncbi:hypothetical protein BH20PSE1_BH20PSE1_00900 [soil metagenome]
MAAADLVTTVINNAIKEANKAADKAKTYTDQAQTASHGSFTLGRIHTPERPNVTLPPFDPNEDLGAAFTLAFDNAVADFDPDFKREIKDFLNNWFPSWNGCLKTAVDPWICNTISAGGVGLPQAVSDAIWNRERERELLETSRLQSEAADSFAARGFSLPSGVLLNERSIIAQAGADKISAASRDRAIQDGQIRIDMLKFAVEKGVQMRLGVLDALVNFLNAWIKIPALAIEKAKALTEAKTKLWDQSSSYIRALLGVAELLLHYDEIRTNSDLRTQDAFVQGALGQVDAQVRAAMGAADTMGQIAGSAMGSINSLASIDNSTIESGG